MFVTVIFILSALVVLCDLVAYKRYICGCSIWVRAFVGLLFVAANLLPYIAATMLWMDTIPSIVPMMWILTIYTLLSVSRLALYCGILTIKNSRVKWAVGGALCTIVAMVLIVGVVHTRKAITVRSVEISSTHLPQAFDGYRIAFFSDMHIGSMTSAVEMCEALVSKINSLNADLVVFGGDLVNARYDELKPELAKVLSGVRARDGVVAVLGNHDTGVYVRDTISWPMEENTRQLVERMEAMGWRVVNDDTEPLVRGVDTLTLTGIGFSRELLDHRHSADVAESLDLRPIYEGVPCDKFNITVSHMPQLWRKIYGLGYGDLVLSGHVHAMQIKGRVGRYQFSPAQLMYGEWSGLYSEQNSHLYITDGVGSVGFHLRVGTPPEVTELILCRAD